MRLHRAILSLAWALPASILNAQSFSMGPAFSAIQMDVQRQSLMASVNSSTTSQLDDVQRSTDAEAEVIADAGPLLFSPSSARRAANLRAFVDKSRASNPSGAADLEQVFASGDVIEQLAGEMRKYGLQADNLADVYALWWISAWEAANGRASTEDRGTIAAVREQSARALLAVPDFKAMSNADKQTTAEALMVQAMLVSALNDKYRADPTYGPQLRAATAKGARGMGLDLSAMELTPDGFIMRKGASAADVPTGPLDERDAVAAAQVEGASAPSSDTELATYALPALGGAAALAAVFFLGRAGTRRG